MYEFRHPHSQRVLPCAAWIRRAGCVPRRGHVRFYTGSGPRRLRASKCLRIANRERRRCPAEVDRFDNAGPRLPICAAAESSPDAAKTVAGIDRIGAYRYALGHRPCCLNRRNIVVKRKRDGRVAFGAAMPDPNTLVFGIVEGYTSDGIRLRTQPLVEPSPGGSPVAGVAPIPGPKIPATLVVRVSGKTVDAVPGGFRSIRTGDRITAVVELAGSSQPIAKYLSDFTVLGKNVRPDRMVAPHSFASFSREAVAQSAFAEAMTRLQPNAAAPVKFSFKGQTSPYAKGLLTPVEPAFPYPIQMPFGSITIQWESSLSFGESVNYPLQLVDESASYSWNENFNWLCRLRCSTTPRRRRRIRSMVRASSRFRQRLPIRTRRTAERYRAVANIYSRKATPVILAEIPV